MTAGPAPDGASRDAAGGVRIALLVAERGLSTGERERLETELTGVRQQIARLEQLLANPQFVGKAPAEVVERNRARLAELQRRRADLESGLGG